jgi:hypothetical protein
LEQVGLGGNGCPGKFGQRKRLEAGKEIANAAAELDDPSAIPHRQNSA